MNHLTCERSAYLRQHAGNPVDWFPWSSEALGLARRLDRPILLSIGYSACHWCHVMERECFEDPAIARQMNEGFIAVKVDREERPDLDQLYQGAAQLFGRGGGWPLTVFLTPDLRPFYAGTYFPPENRHGLPGFPRVLAELERAWRERRAELEAQSRSMTLDLEKLTSFGLDAAPGELVVADVVQAARSIERDLDPVNGGFGYSPKFPMVSALALLGRGARRANDASLAQGALKALSSMVEGGLYDQLGGGFHRYSVDARWQVPHFEKMLYDNAQLLHLLAEAEQQQPSARWRKAASETVGYVLREMTSPEGGFFATQDADSEGVEGKFFVWTGAELAAALPPPLADLSRAHFGVTDAGNFEHGATVLHVERTAQALAAERGLDVEQVESDLALARRLLFQARELRVKPARDEKIITAWNGLMIRGLALASRAFRRPAWAALASRAADYALCELWRDGTLSRTAHGGAGFLEDYGALASGLHALYQAGFEEKYLEAARALVERAGELFWDEGQSAYLTAPRAQSDLVVSAYSLIDEACPSGASLLTEAQVTLAALTDAPELLERPGRYLARMKQQAQKSPLGFAHLWLAADAFLDGAAEVTLVGPADELPPFIEALGSAYAPTVAVRSGAAAAKAKPPRSPVAGRAAAYLCRGFSCLPPVTTADGLRRSLTG